MKRLILTLNLFFGTLFLVIVTALVSCGPTDEEKAATEKTKQDSIAAYNSTPPSADLIAAPTASYVRLLSTTKQNQMYTSGVEVFLVGSDTVIVITSPGCDNVVAIKK